MNIIVVDDESLALEDFKIASRGVEEYKDTKYFKSSVEALDHAKENKVDFALVDIRMPEIDGIELIRLLKKLYPKIITVFLTAYKEYLSEFIELKADYYLLKPCEKEKLIDVARRAKKLLLPEKEDPRVRVRTFGQFDVFLEGEVLSFNGKKTKELFAFFVSKNGSIIDTEEAFSCLYEGKKYNKENAKAYYKILKRLLMYLEKKGIRDIIVTDNGHHRLDVDKVECDYFDFLKEDEKIIKTFQNTFLSNYYWGEEILGNLTELKKIFMNKYV